MIILERKRLGLTFSKVFTKTLQRPSSNCKPEIEQSKVIAKVFNIPVYVLNVNLLQLNVFFKTLHRHFLFQVHHQLA